jgi:hypothetical protein
VTGDFFASRQFFFVANAAERRFPHGGATVGALAMVLTPACRELMPDRARDANGAEDDCA